MKNALIMAFLMLIISSCNKDEENIYTLGLSDNAIRELNQKIESISSKTKNDFTVLYTKMIGTLDNPKYDLYSWIGSYKGTDEYTEFMNYCKAQDKKIYLLLIKKVAQDYNYLASEALKDIAENEFGYSLEFSKATGITEEDVRAAYVVLIERLTYEI